MSKKALTGSIGSTDTRQIPSLTSMARLGSWSGRESDGGRSILLVVAGIA
jgi:hypothetical protein